MNNKVRMQCEVREFLASQRVTIAKLKAISHAVEAGKRAGLQVQLRELRLLLRELRQALAALALAGTESEAAASSTVAELRGAYESRLASLRREFEELIGQRGDDALPCAAERHVEPQRTEVPAFLATERAESLQS